MIQCEAVEEILMKLNFEDNITTHGKCLATIRNTTEDKLSLVLKRRKGIVYYIYTCTYLMRFRALIINKSRKSMGRYHITRVCMHMNMYVRVKVGACGLGWVELN